MDKTFTKSLLFIIVLTVFCFGHLFGQTITVGAVDPGPYAPGSSIAVPIAVTGTCVTTATTYDLFLSDASGSFASPKLIGSFKNFYATFVNGVIPAGTAPGVNYKVRAISNNPAFTSTTSAAFTINGGVGVVAGVSSSVINPTYPEVFGSCSGANNATFSFVNESTPGANVIAGFYNELSKTFETFVTPTAAGAPFTAKAAHYTVTVKAVGSGVVGTKAYFLINNAVNTSFGVTGSNTICLDGGGGLTYNVDISSSSGIQNNFPGLVYNIKWGEGTTSSLTLCDIVTLGGKISHNYTKSSCGNNPNGIHNSFEVDLQPSSVYCGKVGTQVTSYAHVISAPLNLFRSPPTACVNTAVTFTNISDPGQDPNNTTASCKSANALYSWIVDGVTTASNYTLNQKFVHTFTTAGTHKVTIHLQNSNALCTATDFSLSICTQNPPQPIFKLSGLSGCAPATIATSNQSIIDANCNASNTFVWTVTGPSAVGFANGTSASSAAPQFVFNTPGVYQVKLGITTASCGVIETPVQTVVINSTPIAQLSADIIFCGTNQTLNFNTATGPTQTHLTGNAQNLPGTYNWTVTGGAFAFVGGTTAASQYPQISFSDLAAYTVTVTNTNPCGPQATATQHITFKAAPIVSAGSDAPICGNQAYTLQGSITGQVNSQQWVGGNGTFTPDRNTLNATYLPSADEIAAGSVTLTLMATTSLAAPCDNVSASVKLTITQPDAITSSNTAPACSGSALNYHISAAIPNSTFTWTVDQANTTPTASGYATNGNGTTIKDILVNSDPANYAIVTYNIIAVGGSGCASNAFVLTVSVAPKQSIAKFTQDVASGCGPTTVQFTNASIPANSTYSWDFGDGSSPIADTNPSHTFAADPTGKDKTYTVTLSSTSNCGIAVPSKSTVTVYAPTPVAAISPKQLNGCSPFTLVVDNLSPGTNTKYDYYLYDGATLVEEIIKTDKSEASFKPINTAETKEYSLYMIATGPCGTNAESNTIPISVSANSIIAQTFPQNGTNKGCAPLNLTFINNSVGADTYHYDISDANHQLIDSKPAGTAPLPYTFGTPGTYYVTVTGTNNCSIPISAPAFRVDVYALPAPQFTADVTTGCRAVSVQFTNQTPDDPTAALLYDWDFGDGTAHALTFTPPPHLYSYKNSPFTVTLTVTNSVTKCFNISTKPAYINITAPPATAFIETPDSVTNIPNYRFSFTDQTTGHPVLWFWNFGDGSSSVEQNPGHTYADTGLYKVTLTTTAASQDGGCDSTIIHHVRITGTPGQLFLPNAFEPGAGTAELRTFMAKGSGIKEWHMQVFNKYAQLVWETNKLGPKGVPIDGWDGTLKGSPAPQGVYVWQVSATFINGTEWKGNVINNSLPKRSGVIHLIR